VFHGIPATMQRFGVLLRDGLPASDYDGLNSEYDIDFSTFTFQLKRGPTYWWSRISAQQITGHEDVTRGHLQPIDGF